MADLSSSKALTEKTDAELLFFAQHPELYHPELLAAAQRELRRRGIEPNPAAKPEATATAQPAYDDEEVEPGFWQRPAPWVSLLALLLVGGLLYWNSQRTKAAQAAAAQQISAAPTELETVETHLIPAFDSLTRSQIEQEMRQLSAPDRAANPTALGKYKLLAERYWKAENQSTYLFSHLTNSPTSGVPGQATVVLEEWRRLTKALVYNHGLTPVLAERMDLMRRAAYLRIETLQTITRRSLDNQPLLDTKVVALRDSATHMREALLSRQKWTARLRSAVL